MHTPCARWARFSVLGIRPSASIQIRYRVSGPRYLVPLPDCPTALLPDCPIAYHDRTAFTAST